MSKEFSAMLDRLLDGNSLSEQEAHALMVKLAEGDMVVIETPGGGGFGLKE